MRRLRVRRRPSPPPSRLAGLTLAGRTRPRRRSRGRGTELYLVTLTGPGTCARGRCPSRRCRSGCAPRRTRCSRRWTPSEPVYRWTTALSGVAVELTADQAEQLAADPRVALVERDRVLAPRRLDGTAATGAGQPLGHARGGAGTVIGFVDSGLTPEGPVFAGTPGLGPRPPASAASAAPRRTGPTAACTPEGRRRPVVRRRLRRRPDPRRLLPVRPRRRRARHRGRLRGRRQRRARGAGPRAASRRPSPASRRRPGSRRTRPAGPHRTRSTTAARPRTWSAPIDRATADGVDVLNVSVAADDGARPGRGHRPAGAPRRGRGRRRGRRRRRQRARARSATPHPWITTVGAVTSDVRRGLVERRGARRAARSDGLRTGGRPGPAGPRRRRRAPPAATRDDARLCVPGSLDAAKVGGRIVLCARGGVGRTDKSLAVQQADGVGMVLANQVHGSLDPDLHAVPTVHVDAEAGRRPRALAVPAPARPGHPAARAASTRRPPRVRRLVTRAATRARRRHPGRARRRQRRARRRSSRRQRHALAAGQRHIGGRGAGQRPRRRDPRATAPGRRRSSAAPWPRPRPRSAGQQDRRRTGRSRRRAVRLASASTSRPPTTAPGSTVAAPSWAPPPCVLDRDRRTVTRTVTNLSRTHADLHRARVAGSPGCGSPQAVSGSPRASRPTSPLRLVGRLRDAGPVACWCARDGPRERWRSRVSPVISRRSDGG